MQRRGNGVFLRHKFLSILIFMGVLLFGLNCTQALALSVNPSNISGEPGDTVTLEISIDTAVSNMTDWGMDIYFDTDVLTFKSVDSAGTLSSALTTSGSAKAYGARIGAFSLGGSATGDPGTLIKVLLDVKSTAYKNSTIHLQDFTDYIASATTTDSAFTIQNVTTAVTVTPASTTDLAAGAPQILTAEVSINGSPLTLTSANDVVFTKTSGTGTLGAASLVGGNVQVTYTSATTVETATITATEKVTGNDNTGTATITTVAGPPSAANSTVAANPSTGVVVSDDGSSSSTITVTIKDANNNAVSGQTVVLSSTGTGNTITQPTATTDASGVATGTISSTKAGTKTVTAKVGGTTMGTVDVTFVAGAFSTDNSTVTAAPATQTADGTAVSTITVTLKDSFDNPVAGQTVTLEATGTGNTIVQPAAATDAAGVATGTIASTKAEQKTVTAKVGTTTVKTVDVTFTAGAAAKLALSADKTTIASDGKGTATLSAQLQDANGNNVAQQGTTISFTPSDATYVAAIADATTDATGLATATMTTKAGTVAAPPATTDVTATSAGLTNSNAVTFTIVNFSINVTAPAAPFYDATGIHLVTSGSTPSTATFAGMGGTSGNYRWALASVGTIDSTDADAITYTAPASITLPTGGSSVKDTLTLTDATNASLTATIDIYICNPVAMNMGTATYGLAVGGTLPLGPTGGTGVGVPPLFNFISSAPGVATVDADGVITAVAAGTCTVEALDKTYGATGVANGFRDVTPTIDVVTAITVTGAAVLDSAATTTYTAAGGKNAGQYVWAASDGAIDPATGEYTAPTVTTGSKAVTITAYDATYNKDSASPVMGQATVTVYAPAAMIETPAGYDPTKPETYPLMALGATTTLTAKDAARKYDWVIVSWIAGTGPIVSDLTGTTNFVVNPDTLFAAAGAGVYKVIMADHDNASVTPAELLIRVPMKFTATKFNAASGTYYSNQGTDTFTITGGPAATDVYKYEALDMAGTAVTAENCGTLVDASPTDATNDFTFTAGIPKSISFRVKVALDSASNDADVARLIEAGLGEIWSGVFTVIPRTDISGTVVDAADGTTPVAGVTVTWTDLSTKTATTIADGSFTIANFDNTGATYKFIVASGATTILSKIVTLDDIEAGPIKVDILAEVQAISGTVSPFVSNTAVTTIRCKDAAGDYITDSTGAVCEVIADPNTGNNYHFQMSNTAVGPFTVEFRRPGYIFDDTLGLGVLTNVAGATVGNNITLAPVTKIFVDGTRQDSTDIVAGTNYDQVLVEITALPAFDGTAAEIAVTDDAGAPIVVTYAGGIWSFVHTAYESFTIDVKADTSEATRDASTGYYKASKWTYVKSAASPQNTTIADPNTIGGTANSGSGNATVDIVAGESLTGEVRREVVVSIVEADASDAGAKNVTGSEIVDVTLLDENGDPVSNNDIARIVITMKFDPTVVTAGKLESGAFSIHQAATMADLVKGNVTAVPVSQIIQPIDYTNGVVTFWVDHLSAFGIGGALGGGGGDDSDCFIETAAHGAMGSLSAMILSLALMGGVVLFGFFARRKN